MGNDPQRSIFPASLRVKKRREYQRIQGRGRKIWGQRFIYMISRGATPSSRLGITVSRKVGNAVKRNRIKRWVREVFRKHPDRFIKPIDIVVIAKRNIDDFSYSCIEEEFLRTVDTYMQGGTSKKSEHSTRSVHSRPS